MEAIVHSVGWIVVAVAVLLMTAGAVTALGKAHAGLGSWLMKVSPWLIVLLLAAFFVDGLLPGRRIEFLQLAAWVGTWCVCTAVAAFAAHVIRSRRQVLGDDDATERVPDDDACL